MIGTIITFYWEVPFVAFFAVFYPFGDEKGKEFMLTKHKLYLYIWIFFVVSHLLLFLPLTILWTQLAFYEWADELTGRYTFWLE